MIHHSRILLASQAVHIPTTKVHSKYTTWEAEFLLAWELSPDILNGRSSQKCVGGQDREKAGQADFLAWPANQNFWRQFSSQTKFCFPGGVFTMHLFSREIDCFPNRIWHTVCSNEQKMAAFQKKYTNILNITANFLLYMFWIVFYKTPLVLDFFISFSKLLKPLL